MGNTDRNAVDVRAAKPQEGLPRFTKNDIIDYNDHLKMTFVGHEKFNSKMELLWFIKRIGMTSCHADA